ncbi:MAG: DNA translocase FtsK 4TM domain-containing protein, partial [Thalassobaculum sp.]
MPDVASRYLKRRAAEIAGIVLVALAAALAVALVGFDVADPSLNTAGAAGGREIANPLGLAGAVVADLLLQSLGVASALLVLVPAIWGWRLLRHEAIGRPALRVALLPPALALATLAAAAAPVPPTWPLRAGLGGFLGQLFLQPSGRLIPYLEPVGGIVPVAILAGLLAIGLALWCVGYSVRDAAVGLWMLARAAAGLIGRGARLGWRGAGAGARV